MSGSESSSRAVRLLQRLLATLGSGKTADFFLNGTPVEPPPPQITGGKQKHGTKYGTSNGCGSILHLACSQTPVDLDVYVVVRVNMFLRAVGTGLGAVSRDC